MITERMQQLAGVQINEGISLDDVQKTKIPYKVMTFGGFHNKYRPSGTVKGHKIVGVDQTGISFNNRGTKAHMKWEYVGAENIVYITKRIGAQPKVVQIAMEYKNRDPIVYKVGR